MQSVVTSALDGFVHNIQAALPNIISGVVFLVLAALVVKAVLFILRIALDRMLPGESPVYRQFIATIAALFLWFSVALTFLSILGFTNIAASLGTASGFIALGVSYAASDMIADAVAGVYLLRDPDFMPGDTVETAKASGVVKSIELRKTRFDVDGDTVVVGNSDIENNWTKHESGEENGSEDDEATASAVSSDGVSAGEATD